MRRFGESPEEVVAAAIVAVEKIIEELALLADSTANDAVRLGAIKSRLGATSARLDLMRALGTVPDLRWVADQRDGRKTADTIIDIFDRHNVADAAYDELPSIHRFVSVAGGE